MNSINVCILDYGSGNVNSVFNILEYMKYPTIISNSENEIKKSTHIILPGVGSFGSAMKKIKSKIPLRILESEVIKYQKPILGICVGMQVFASTGFENGVFDGLGWINGNVKRLKSGNLSLPHIGWQNIDININSKILSNISDHDFYFLHSYVFKPKNNNNIIANTVYGEKFCSVINKKNIFGTQFHPEKSQQAGMQLIKNFLTIND